MKSLLLTAYDDRMAPLGDLTAPRMLGYANRHGMDFRCVRQFPVGRPAYWHKMLCVVEAFEENYNRVIWLDADQLITNPDVIPPGDYGFNASQDWGQDSTGPECFSMCGFTAFSNSLHLFQWVINHEADYIYGLFPEQTPMRHLYTEKGQRGCITIWPRRAYNAVPIEVHETVVEPWQPGDFCMHITMLSVPERLEILKQYAN